MTVKLYGAQRPAGHVQRSVVTLRQPLVLALGILAILSTTALPTMAALGVTAPAWGPVVSGAGVGLLIVAALMSGGMRKRRTMRHLTGTVEVALPHEPHGK